MASLQAHLRKILSQPGGARYYKVDLHIHTPSSLDGQGSKRYGYDKKDARQDRANGYVKARALAGRIVDRLVHEHIQVAAFTDHNSPGYLDNEDFSTPSWYDFISEAYEQKRGADPDFPQILLLPGVEITTDRIHILGIFDNQTSFVTFKIASLLRSVDIREHEFGQVDGVFGTKSIWEVADAIDEMGGICIPAHINALSSRSLLRQFAPPDMEVERLVQHRAIHVFGVVPTSTPWPDHRTYQSLMENKTVKAAGNPTFHEWMVAKRAQVPQHLPALGYMMNSDAHAIEKIGERFSWVKMDDLSFRSLAGALRNPFYRVAPNHLEPVSTIRTRLLGASLEGGFAGGLVLRFNPHFNCVVGKPMMGKTTLMRAIHDTLWGKRLGLRMRDEVERTIEGLSPGLWDLMLGGEVFTKAGTLRDKLPDEVKGGLEAAFLENHAVPWNMFVYLTQVEQDGSQVVYAAERRRLPAGEKKEDEFIYYRSEPYTGDLSPQSELEFTEIEAKDFRNQVAMPGFHFDRCDLGDEAQGFDGARGFLDRHLLRSLDNYASLRNLLFGLARQMEVAAEQAPPDTAQIAVLAEQVRQALGEMFTLRTTFAESFNATEREHAMRIAFRKGAWESTLAATPTTPELVDQFAHNVREYLHGREFFDHLDLKFFQPKKRGKGWDEITFSQLTPAQRSLMALRLLLNSSTEMAPLIVSDPEDWLDNEALLEFYDLRRIRDDQLIVFTRNATIAMLGNAEQAIILDRDTNLANSNTTLLACGGLETAGVAKSLIQLLEGGKIAFQRKLLRYRAEMEMDGIRIDLHRL